MAGKEFGKADLEQMLVSFENRQETRQDETLKQLEEAWRPGVGPR